MDVATLGNLFSDAFWMTASFICAIVISVTSTINGKLNPNKTWKYIISWAVSFAVTFGAYFMNVIAVAEPTWVSLIGVSIVVGLSSNGIYEIGFIKNLMKNWMTYLNKGKFDTETENKVEGE